MVDTWTFVRTGAALSCLALALSCGDDGGGGGDNGDGEGDSLTLEDALKTAGTDTSDERAELLFEASCEEEAMCDSELDAQDCADGVYAEFQAGKKDGLEDECLDATLDLYACFASEDCNTILETCKTARDKQTAACPEDI